MSDGTDHRDLALQRVDDADEAVEALAAANGGRVALDDLLAGLDRRVRRSRRVPGRAVHEAWRLAGHEQLTLRWWPQGVTTSADAHDEALGARRVAMVSSYAKKLPIHRDRQGSRLTVLDLDAGRAGHVLLVRATADGGVEPLHVHAGGLVWHRGHLHVAATGKGLFTFRLADVVRLADPRAAFGYRLVLPVAWQYRARTAEGVERFRYSFLGLDHGSAGGPSLLAGEYTNAAARTRRLARLPLDPITGLPTGDVELIGSGPLRMQGVAAAGGRVFTSVSQGRTTRGSVFADDVEHPHATPMGNEDLAHSPADDLLWGVSEHPTARWLFTMRRSYFD
ncbi:hypothetical protein GCM10023340_14240 [Nocardioides marinquilinus]|uniref:Phage tail protein n=1 Tax=Nocardioides marinquilinus TaxID=1210400 RepID=A0ABP9PEC2_9ACTN